MRLQDLSGSRFGRLLVIERGKNIGPHTAFICKCECGSTKLVRAQTLKRGDTTSCGCVRSEIARGRSTKHNEYRSPTYNSWRAMLARCQNEKHRQFNDYGGRGIAVCDAWANDYAAFLSDMGARPSGKTLDRINTNGNYEPGNCRWATPAEQNSNKRRANKAANPITQGAQA